MVGSTAWKRNKNLFLLKKSTTYNNPTITTPFQNSISLKFARIWRSAQHSATLNNSGFFSSDFSAHSLQHWTSAYYSYYQRWPLVAFVCTITPQLFTNISKSVILGQKKSVAIAVLECHKIVIQPPQELPLARIEPGSNLRHGSCAEEKSRADYENFPWRRKYLNDENFPICPWWRKSQNCRLLTLYNIFTK